MAACETTNDRQEFMDHMRAAGATLHHMVGDTEVWACVYVMRDNVQAGTWDAKTNTGTLDLI